MKTGLLIALLLASVSAFGQGRIRIENDTKHLLYFWTRVVCGDGGYINHPVPTVLPSGVTLLVDLYGGTSAGNMTLQTTVPMSTTVPGTFGPVNFTSPNLVGGGVVTLQIKVRDSAYPTAEAAEANFRYSGYSPIFTMTPGTSLAYASIVNPGSPAFSTWANGNFNLGISGLGAVEVRLPGFLGLPVVYGPYPQSSSYVAGTNVTLEVLPDGTSPFRYEWRKNGNFIVNAINHWRLTLTNLTLMDAGYYDAVVTNCVGSATSLVSVVQVLPVNAPSIRVNNTLAVGTVTSAVPANISITGGFSGGQIFYTLDGSPPTDGSTLYSGAFFISNSCTLRAISFGGNPTQTSEAPPVTVMTGSSSLLGGQLKNPRSIGDDFVCDLIGAAFRGYQIL